jgi:hypothetical protein
MKSMDRFPISSFSTDKPVGRTSVNGIPVNGLFAIAVLLIVNRNMAGFRPEPCHIINLNHHGCNDEDTHQYK